MTTITINGNVVEPSSQCEGGSQYEVDASNSNYILLHVNTILANDQYAELKRLHVQILQYVGENTYLCLYEPKDLAEIRGLGFVVYANVYHQDLVIQDDLKSKCGINPTSPDPLVPQRASQKTLLADESGEEAFNILVMLHKNPPRSPEQLKEALTSQLNLDPSTIRAGDDRLQMKVTSQQLQQIAPLEEVKTIEELPEQVPHNHIAREDLKFVDYKQLAFGLVPAEYDAKGEMVAVADTGFDKGTLADVHPAFQKRVKALIPVNSDNPNCEDRVGHGTHCCGSVACSHVSKQFGVVKGTAPGADLIVLGMGNMNGKLEHVADGKVFFKKAYDLNARIQSNSWGPGVDKDASDPTKKRYKQWGYLQLAKDVDNFMRENDDFLIVFAAGNDGRVASATDTKATIGAQATAKNCITVGACESSHQLEYAYKASSGGWDKGDPDNVASFSSVGPTKNTAVAPNNNSRNKPDVVAPGTTIYSTRSRFTPLQWHLNTDTGKIEDINIDGDASGDPLWAFLSGTSMATPLVSGCAAVLRKLLMKTHARVPAALLKALIINGTTDLQDTSRSRGHSPLGPPPDRAQGYGRLNIAASIRNVMDTVNCGYRTPGPLVQNDTFGLPLKIPPPSPPIDGHHKTVLSATMCYNDLGDATDLVNILTLKATQTHPSAAPGTPIVKFGNTNSLAPDLKNNVQKVVWEWGEDAGVIGEVVLEVKCEVIRPPAVDQDFVLVWSVDYVKTGMTAGEIALIAVVSAAAVAAVIAAIALA